jgi:sarcosine/dimethylglycine N-methyltransferase
MDWRQSGGDHARGCDGFRRPGRRGQSLFPLGDDPSNRRRQRHGGSHPDKSVDVVISQEALLHIPDRRRAMGEAFRILKLGGRLAFTDWIAPAPLAKDDADLLWEGQAVQALESPKSYRDLLTDIGFRVRSSDDLTAQWAVLLKARLAMYQKLRIEAEAAGTPSGHDAFHKSYVRLVDLMGAHVLGGVRIVAERK